MSAVEICKAVKDKFGTKIDLRRNQITFVKLNGHDCMLAEKYPSWTLFW